MKDKTITLSAASGLSGRIHVQILEAKSKKVIKDFGWQKNLILNSGLNFWFSTTNGSYMPLASQIAVAVIGIGTTPTKTDPSPTTASQSGTTVTLSGGTFVFTSGHVGNELKWGSGERALITAYIDPANVTVNLSQTVIGGAFTMYLTSQTGLVTERKRSSTYVTGATFCETVFITPNQFRMRRTFDFTAETGPVTYTEAGFSPVSAAGNNIFSRVLFDSPADLTAGLQMRIQYDMTVTFTPGSPQNGNLIVTGWPVAPATTTNGAFAIEVVPMAWISSNGSVITSGFTYDATALEPGSSATYIQCNAVTSALQATPSQVTIRSDVPTGSFLIQLLPATYVSNSFTRSRSGTFSTIQSNLSTIRSVVICGYTGNINAWTCRFLFNEAQTKDNTHTLTFVFQVSAQRDLA